MLSYPSAISLSTRSLNHLADLVRDRRNTLRSGWRRLDAGQQALLALAHLRNGDAPAQLAAGFTVGATTAWRYVREAVDLLAATAPTLAQAMAGIARLAYAILDGALIRNDRLGGTANRRYYAGKPRHHAINAQVIADCAGRLKWVSPALPGSTHDLTAAREHGIIDALTDKGVMTFADKGYQGAGGTVRTPHKRHHPRPPLSRNQKAVNRSHARIRALGERANATLKTWKILARLRCCLQRASAILAAIFVLQLTEEQRHPG
jgi:dienelactone hydrolase